ncbi:MAG: NAD-dependent epimerase/dehydratase family protein [Pseudomonadota bacterium]
MTGANGYVGRALCAELARKRIEYLQLTRHKRSDTAGAETLYGDLLDGELPEFPRALSTVYHLAGVAHSHASQELYQRVNVQGSLKVASAAIRAGVRRFVFVSSVKAALIHDPARERERQEGSTGSALPNGQSSRVSSSGASNYANSKAEAEAQLTALCESSAMQLLIVRPALVYDNDAPGHLAMLKRWCRWRLPAPPDRGSRSMVARSDLIRLLISLHETPVQLAQPITLTDGQRYSTARIHRAYCAAQAVEPLLPSLPASVWTLSATIYERLRGLPSGSTLDRIFGEELYKNSGLDELGFSTQATLESVLGVRE